MTANFLANVGGQAWRAAMLIVFVPIYIRLLGIEAYGLIGILATLQMWLALLDLGLRPALGREMARFTGGVRSEVEIWALLRSIELVMLALAVIIFLAVTVASPFLAEHWVHPTTISSNAVRAAFISMGFVIAAQLLEEVYVGSLAGLQRQVIQNAIATIAVTARGLGAVAILLLFGPSIVLFFVWQGVVSLASMIAAGVVVYQSLPPQTVTPRFSVASLREIRSYAGGMIGIAIVSLSVSQTDKVILSTGLSLADFGVYALAGAVANALSLIATPVGGTFFPRFVELYERQDSLELSRVFHQAAQLLTVFVGSAGVVIAFFSTSLLAFWTGDAHLAAKGGPILSVLAVGAVLVALSLSLYALRSSAGWMELTIRINIVIAVVYVPLLFWAASRAGGFGAALAWLVAAAAMLVAAVIGTFKRLLRGERGRFVVFDCLVPLAVTVGAAGLFRALFPIVTDRILGMMLMAAIGLVTFLAGLCVAPEARGFVFGMLLRKSPSDERC